MNSNNSDNNNLGLFFCQGCDKLMNGGSFKKKENGILRYFCYQCHLNQQQTSTTTFPTESEGEFERAEHIEEVCECLVKVESTVKQIRTQVLQMVRQQKLQQPHQHYKEGKEEEEICEVCQQPNQNKAEIYCVTDETKFCRVCFEKTHTLPYHKKHSTKTIQQWSKEIKQQKTSSRNQQKGDKRECECPIEMFTPIFCISHEKIFCGRCCSKEHNKCQTMSVDSRAQEEKERIKIMNFQTLLSERIGGFVEIENSLTEFLELLENLKTQTSKKILELKKSETQLRETKEYWCELDQKLGDNVWAEKEFVSNVENQIKKMREKWERREKEEREGSRQQLLKIKKKIEEFEENLKSKEVKEYYFENNNKVALILKSYVPNKGTLITEGSHTWKVKINKVVPSTDVGVIKPEHNTHFNTGKPTAWGIREHGNAYHERSDTGCTFKDGDIITFNLDLSKRTLNYKINGKEVPFTHTNVTSPVHIAFSGGSGASAQIFEN